MVVAVIYKKVYCNTTEKPNIQTLYKYRGKWQLLLCESLLYMCVIMHITSAPFTFLRLQQNFQFTLWSIVIPKTGYNQILPIRKVNIFSRANDITRKNRRQWFRYSHTILQKTCFHLVVRRRDWKNIQYRWHLSPHPKASSWISWKI